MTKTDHLAKAKDYIAKGDTYHRKAAEEIVAAMKEDPSLSHADIAARIGKSKSWVGHLVRSVTSGQVLSDFKVEWAREKPSTTATKALRDPATRVQVIASLSHDERAELVNEVAKVPALPAPDKSREALRDHMQDAVAADLTAQVAKLIAGASRIDLLLAERGAEFRRINSDQAARLDSDLERVMNTIRDVRGELLKHREIEVTS